MHDSYGSRAGGYSQMSIDPFDAAWHPRSVLDPLDTGGTMGQQDARPYVDFDETGYSAKVLGLLGTPLGTFVAGVGVGLLLARAFR